MAATKKPRTATVKVVQARLPGFADPEVLRVNVSLPEPGTLVQERKG